MVIPLSLTMQSYLQEPGEYEVRVAASVTDMRLRATFTLTGECRRLKTRSVLLAATK
jgi:hypothetical protein